MTVLEKRILAIIPARGGSKGIPGKNTLSVGGKPMIAHTIGPALQALQEGAVQELIVSTDDEGIAAIARQWGAPVPFLRPPSLAGDRSRSIDYVLHALDYFAAERGQAFDAVLILQPTSPLRRAEHIVEAVAQFRSATEPSLISCFQEPSLLPTILYFHEEGHAVPLAAQHNTGSARQDVSPLYVRNGAIYLCDVDYLRQHGKLVSDRPLLFEMSKAQSVNLDSAEDLETLRSYFDRQPHSPENL